MTARFFELAGVEAEITNAPTPAALSEALDVMLTAAVELLELRADELSEAQYGVLYLLRQCVAMAELLHGELDNATPKHPHTTP